jgi:hypothetical protein
MRSIIDSPGAHLGDAIEAQLALGFQRILAKPDP